MTGPWRRRPRSHAPPSPLSLYRPGASPFHRAPAGVKLLGLLGLSTAVVAIDAPVVSSAVLVVAAGAIVAVGVPARLAWRQARPLVAVALLILALQILLGRAQAGVDAATRLLAVAAAALLVTMTTRAEDLIESLERALRRLRVRPDRVFRLGLAVGVALRSIGHLGVVAQRVQDARRARGLQRSLRAFAVPTVVAAARFAHGVGEALEARGIADPDLAVGE